MNAKCSICRHEKAAEIDQALVSGMSVRKTAALFGLKKSAVDIHRRKHMIVEVAKAAVRAARGDRLLEQVLSIQKHGLRLMRKAEAEKNWAGATSGLREFARGTAMLAEVTAAAELAQQRADMASGAGPRVELVFTASGPQSKMLTAGEGEDAPIESEVVEEGPPLKSAVDLALERVADTVEQWSPRSPKPATEETPPLPFGGHPPTRPPREYLTKLDTRDPSWETCTAQDAADDAENDVARERTGKGRFRDY